MSFLRFSSRPALLLLTLVLLVACLVVPTLAQSTTDGSSGGSSGGTTTAAAAADPGTPMTKVRYEWAHGALMSIAFGFFLPVGIIFARFFRSPQYSPLWFHAHRVFMLIGFALIIAGFAIAVNKFDNDKYSTRRGKYHRSAGFYVFAAICLQVALGFIRPATPPPASGEKPTNLRVAWNEVHRYNGRIAYVFGLAQVYTGIEILDGTDVTQMHNWIIIFSALWGSLILFAFLLQVIVIVKGSALGDDGTYTRTTITGNTTEKHNPQVAQQQQQQQQQGVAMQGVKVDDGAKAAAPVPVVQGASVTRPVDAGYGSPELHAVQHTVPMTTVQIA